MACGIIVFFWGIQNSLFPVFSNRTWIFFQQTFHLLSHLVQDHHALLEDTWQGSGNQLISLHFLEI